MRRNGVLKVVVIVQALGMVALAVFLTWQLWPSNQHRSTEQYPSLLDKEDPTADLDEVIAVIADQQITRRELIEQLVELYGDQTLDQMLLHYAIELAARDKGITLTSEELKVAIDEAASGYESKEQYFEVMKEQLGYSQSKLVESIEDHALLIKIVVSEQQISDEEISRYIGMNNEQFQQKKQFRLSWILNENDDDANKVMTLLSEGENFDELAAQYSIDTFTAATGGDLGEIDSDDPFYDQRMLAEAGNMKVGDISGPIETSDGYAIIYLSAVHETKPLTDEQKKREARVELALQKAGSLQSIQEELKNHYAIGIKR